MSEAEWQKRIEDKIDAIMRLLTVTKGKQETAAATVAGTIGAAPDSDLDGEHGDPLVKWDPKKWTGESYVGKRFSQCSPEYLDSVAGLCKWRAKKAVEEGKDPKWPNIDASRAIGWAARIRAGWVAPVGSDFGSDAADPEGEIPF